MSEYRIRIEKVEPSGCLVFVALGIGVLGSGMFLFL